MTIPKNAHKQDSEVGLYRTGSFISKDPSALV
jgi:hypothetical protein